MAQEELLSPPHERSLAEEVRFLPGVGPTVAPLLAKLGIETVGDLLFLPPREHHDLRRAVPIRNLRPGSVQCVAARLEYVNSRTTRDGRPIVTAAFSDPTGYLTVTWYNRPDAAEFFRLDQEYLITGASRKVEGRRCMNNARVDLLPKEDPACDATMTPVYPLTEGLSQEQLRRAIVYALARCADKAPERLPSEFRRERGLLAIAEALRQLHFPRDNGERDRARRRLAYDEFLTLQVAFALKRAAARRTSAAPILLTPHIDERIRARFPFCLTPGQENAVREIVADLARPIPMYRLLQGDVGSGKTAVAIYAMLAAIANKGQTALLAPTELLARQHFELLDQMLAGSRVERTLFTGAASAQERGRMLASIAAGDAHLVIGTHALLNPDVAFAKLSLVVIDEQHKFGVRQRAEFQLREPMPHQLVMTATPIPRSLGMAWFGDLDFSTLADRPPGRQPVTTRVATAAERGGVYAFLAGRAKKGERCLLVCPRIEDGDDGAWQSVQRTAAELAAGPCRDVPLAVLHGRLPDAEKESAVARFRRGEVLVLVSTTVVEVGMDLPGASVMVVEHAERFGLSQLHQLRGRIGRDGSPGSCILIDGGVEPSERLQTLAATESGFVVAELDARQRGIGELVGEMQHGRKKPRFADFSTDLSLLEQARKDAALIVTDDPTLAKPEWATLREDVLREFGENLRLALVG